MKPDYTRICQRLRVLTENIPYETANLANASALLWQNLEDINWAGFYQYRDGILVLGPFQGKPACVKIPMGKGVCGTAAQRDAMQLVDNVHEFPGHIACDGASNSEIVVPLHVKGALWGVLDIDSPLFSRFTPEDAAGLARFAQTLEEILEKCSR